MTPLHWAVERNQIEAVETLLKYGANVDAVSKFEKTPLEIASDNGRPDVYEMLQNFEDYRRMLPAQEYPQVSDPVTLAATRSIALDDDPATDEIVPGLLATATTAAGAKTSKLKLLN